MKANGKTQKLSPLWIMAANSPCVSVKENRFFSLGGNLSKMILLPFGKGSTLVENTLPLRGPLLNLKIHSISEFDQVWKPIGAMEYLKSGKSRTYKKAEEMCTKFGGNLLNVSKVQASLLDTLELRNVEGVFWIKDTYGTYDEV